MPVTGGAAEACKRPSGSGLHQQASRQTYNLRSLVRRPTMSTKLTLRLDEQLSGQAQRVPAATPTASPITAQLRGALNGATVTEADTQAHLATKHR